MEKSQIVTSSWMETVPKASDSSQLPMKVLTRSLRISTDMKSKDAASRCRKPKVAAVEKAAVETEKAAVAVVNAVVEMNALPVRCKQERKKASMVEAQDGGVHGRGRTEMVAAGRI